MKRITVLLTIGLCCILSCNQPMKTSLAGGNNAMDTEQLLPENEKKTQVEEKKHTADDWTVELTSKLVDTRTKAEIAQNLPFKYNIVNTVLFGVKLENGGLQSSKGTIYYPSFRIQKTIKNETNEIVFTINTDILVTSDTRLLKTKPLQIQLSPKEVVDFNNEAIAILYKKNEALSAESRVELQNIICELAIPIEIINKIRTAKNDVIVLLNKADDVFKISIPKIFLDYLNEL